MNERIQQIDAEMQASKQRLVKTNRRLKEIDIEINVLLKEIGSPHSPIIENYIY